MLRANCLLVSQVLQCSSTWSYSQPPQEAVFSQMLGAGVGATANQHLGEQVVLGTEENSPSLFNCCLDPLPLHADKMRP